MSRARQPCTSDSFHVNWNCFNFFLSLSSAYPTAFRKLYELLDTRGVIVLYRIILPERYVKARECCFRPHT